MKLAFSTLGCPDWSFDEITATAKDLGFDGVEIRGVGNQLFAPAISQFSESRIEKTIEKLKALNVEIPCLTSACCFRDASVIDSTVKETEEYIELAASLGTKYIRILGDETANPLAEVNDDIVCQGIKRVARKAEEYGVILLVETNGAYSDTKRLSALIKSIDSPNVCVLWDVHHPIRYNNESVAETFENIKDYVKYVHIKDSVSENGKVTYKMMGFGDLPVKEIISCLKDNKYDGYISLEWVKRWYAELEAPGVVFMQYISFMRKALR